MGFLSKVVHQSKNCLNKIHFKRIWKLNRYIEPEPFKETLLEKIERIKMGVSLEEAIEGEQRNETTLEKVHRLKSKQNNNRPSQLIRHIDTSNLKVINLLQLKNRKK